MITLYTKPGCGYCASAKNWLNENDFAYYLIDVSANADALAFLKAQGHRSVPQLYIGRTLLPDGWLGLQTRGAAALRQALDTHASHSIETLAL
jgi:glutaredoxin